MFDLPKNLDLFDVNIDKPFTIFEKYNFFKKHHYEKLYDEFPPEKYFTKKHDLGSKKYFNSKDLNFNKFLQTSKSWSEFYDIVNSENFLNEIFNLCKKNLNEINERKKIKKIQFKQIVKTDFISKLLRKFKQLFGIYELRLAFEFSLLKNGDFIPPHNDTENKLVSLMAYFPQQTQLEEKDLGTNFFICHKENKDVWRADMMDKLSSKEFYNNYKIFYKSEFKTNKLVGFIKSKNSWHDVSVINTVSNYRKSLNINLFKI